MMTDTTLNPTQLRAAVTLMAQDWRLQVTRDAARIAEQHIARFGTVIGGKQRAALAALFQVCKAMQFDLTAVERRIGIPFPTGFGKSTSIAAWIVALHKNRDLIHALEVDRTKVPPTVTVAASRVEALCEMKRDILAMARYEDETSPGSVDLQMLEASIGLLHSYRYDEQVTADAAQAHREVPDGYATEPSTGSIEDAMARPYVLATHALMTGKAINATKLSKFRVTESGGDVVDRGIVFWDESLAPSETFTVDFNALMGTVERLKWLARDRHALREAADWAAEVASVVQPAFESGGAEVTTAICQIPAVEEERLLRIRSAIKSSADLTSDLSAALGMAGMAARIIRRSDKAGGVVTYRPTIPNDIRRVIVLDASYAISKLYEVDRRIQRFDRATDLGRMLKMVGAAPNEVLKTYEDVTLRHMDAGGGRDTIVKNLKAVVRDIVDVVTTKVQPEESVLIFTYKHRDKREKDIPGAILAALQEAGIDTDELVQAPGGGLRRRINVTHWGGSECGSNQYAHCHHVILGGVMHVPSDVHAAGYLGAVDDLSAEYTRAIEREVALSSRAHLAYQALSRGRSRATTKDGKALPMTAWIVDTDPKLIDELQKVLPGVQIADWDGNYRKENTRAAPLTDAAYAKIVEYLASVPPEVDKIKAADLWYRTGLGKENRKARQTALDRLSEAAHGWVKNPNGYGLVRVGSGEAMGFEVFAE